MNDSIGTVFFSVEIYDCFSMEIFTSSFLAKLVGPFVDAAYGVFAGKHTAVLRQADWFRNGTGDERQGQGRQA